MMRTVRAYLRFMAFVITISFYISWCLINKVFFKDFLRRNKKVRSRWIRVIVPILGFKAEVSGTMRAGVNLIVANHRSFSDPLIMLRYLDAFPLAKAEVDQYPLIGVGARATGVLYVARNSSDSRQGARQEIKATLTSGQNVLIYPEGTTGNEAGTLLFKKGSFQVASQLGLKVVPVAIEYEDPSHHWVERSLWGQYLLQFGERECRCRIFIGEGISTTGDDYGASESRRWIEERLAQARKEFSG